MPKLNPFGPNIGGVDPQIERQLRNQQFLQTGLGLLGSLGTDNPMGAIAQSLAQGTQAYQGWLADAAYNAMRERQAEQQDMMYRARLQDYQRRAEDDAREKRREEALKADALKRSRGTGADIDPKLVPYMTAADIEDKTAQAKAEFKAQEQKALKSLETQHKLKKERASEARAEAYLDLAQQREARTGQEPSGTRMTPLQMFRESREMAKAEIDREARIAAQAEAQRLIEEEPQRFDPNVNLEPEDPRKLEEMLYEREKVKRMSQANITARAQQLSQGEAFRIGGQPRVTAQPAGDEQPEPSLTIQQAQQIVQEAAGGDQQLAQAGLQAFQSGRVHSRAEIERLMRMLQRGGVGTLSSALEFIESRR